MIAVDGKTVRGARTADTVDPHLVPAVRDLLAGFDLRAVVVTAFHPARLPADLHQGCDHVRRCTGLIRDGRGARRR